MTKIMRLLRYWCDCHRHLLFARIYLAFTPSLEGTLTILSDVELKHLQEEKSTRRKTRLSELGFANLSEVEKEREEMVSIGIFSCNRFDLLKRTCDSLASFLDVYGHEFPYEVMFFHDGPNQEIEVWVRSNPLFDKVFFNIESKGLAWNFNRFWFKESRGKYILDLEEDWVCEPRDNFIRNAISVLESDDNIGIVRLERKYPGDYRKWNEAYKIHARIFSKQVFTTCDGKHAYRVLEEQKSGEGIWSNSSGLIRFASLVVSGGQNDVRRRPRIQEHEYEKIYNRYWQAARGVNQTDNPFMHIGYGRTTVAPDKFKVI
jgi:hypothetical protein